MIRLQRPLALGVLLTLMGPGCALALSLQEAIGLAQGGNPDLAQSRAEVEAADGRLVQARSGRLPTITLSGETGRGRTDLGGFFGFGQADVSPRAAALEVRQPIFAGGAIGAAVDRARQGRNAAFAQATGEKALLSVQVAEAYVAVLTAREVLALNQAQLQQMAETVRQAELRFKGGETTRSDLAMAHARHAEAQAGIARTRGEVARAEAHFSSVVGVSPDQLEALPAPPPIPRSLDEALSLALKNNPGLQAAEAQSRAAEAGVRFARADRLPSLAVTATASTARDQFFPGYRADGVTVGVQGRWTLFSGGMVSGRIEEAVAGASGARARVESARAQVRETVIGAWGDAETSKALLKAAQDQAEATASALESVRNEVRVGQKPTLDLLDAQREMLAARSAVVSARGGAVIAAYRLNALL